MIKVGGGEGALATGLEMHSAEWNDKVQLDGKRVVVVGSAASAVQIVPAIAPRVQHLTVVQRTPNWLAPKVSPFLPPKLAYPSFLRFLFRVVPGLMRLHRWLLYVQMEVPFLLGLWNGKTHSPFFAPIVQRVLYAYMRRQLGRGPKAERLAELVIPKYEPGCKRIARSDNYLPALARDNVDVVTERLVEVRPEGVAFADGKVVPADVVIWATGYQVGSMGPFKLIDDSGKAYSGTDLMDQGKEMYLGAASPDATNLFFLLGEGSGLGHNSIVLMLETQMNWIKAVLEQCVDEDVKQVTLKKEALDAFSKMKDDAFKTTVWSTGGCASWYRNDKTGKFPALWPLSTVRFFYEGAPPQDLSLFDVVHESGKARI